MTGRVHGVTMAQVPRPADPYRILSLIIIVGVGSLFALPAVIGIVVGLAVASSLMSMLGYRTPKGGAGCSPFILHLLLLRGFHRTDDGIPQLSIRLQDDLGQAHDAVALGRVAWPPPTDGDRIQVRGSRRDGILRIADGRNLTTGARLRVRGSRWRPVFFGLAALMLAGLLLAGLNGGPGWGRAG